MEFSELSSAAGGRCVDCGQLRADGDDGLCPHCRMRVLFQQSALFVEERYGFTWVVFATLVAVILFLALSGAGSVDRGLLAAFAR